MASEIQKSRLSRHDRLRLLLRNIFHGCAGGVILYGAGKRGEVALSTLRRVYPEMVIEGYLDDRPQFKEKDGIRVYSPNELTEKQIDSSLFLLTTYSVKNMISSLGRLGVPADHIHYVPELLITDCDESDWSDFKEEIRTVRDFLSDTLSVWIYDKVFEIYKTGNIGILSQSKGDCQYFPVVEMSDYVEGFSLADDECLVDCGAYNGDTIAVFRKLTDNHFRKIYAFEADSATYAQLVENTAADARVIPINAAVYERECTLSFSSGNGSSSRIDAGSEDTVRAVRIDDAIGDDKVTLIKMDIEGSEMEALKGAEGVIRRDHPKLAVCIYHKLEDLWEIPLFIKSLYDGYRIYVRNYEDRLDEMVCYAIP